jgi:hypothetical protein
MVPTNKTKKRHKQKMKINKKKLNNKINTKIKINK